MNPYLMLGAGVVVGSAATFFAVKGYYKKYYSDICQEEIDSVKKTFSERYEKIKRHNEIESEKDKYTNLIFGEGYVSGEEESEQEEEETEEEEPDSPRIFPEELSDEPYSITPQQFVVERDYYEKVTVLYFNEDNTFVEEMNREIITNPTDLFGDSIQFGEFEEDVAYIRNDRISTDFEIIFNSSAFADEDDY